MPSPDGEHLVFAALDRLYVQEMEGGEPRRLTDLDLIEAQPTWSPDGEWVAFVTWSPAGGHVYKTRISGSEAPVRLTIRPAIYQQPAWSSGGDRIGAIQGPARSYQEATAQGAPGGEREHRLHSGLRRRLHARRADRWPAAAALHLGPRPDFSLRQRRAGVDPLGRERREGTSQGDRLHTPVVPTRRPPRSS